MFWHFLSYLEFREEFPYVVNKKVSWQCTTVNCIENPLDGYYDVTIDILYVIDERAKSLSGVS